MIVASERRLRALGSLARKQEGDLEHARRTHARLLDALHEAEAALERAADDASRMEETIRAQHEVGRALSLEGWRMSRHQLGVLQDEIARRAEQRSEASTRSEEARLWLARCEQHLEVTRRLAERTRVARTRARQKREYDVQDELWLLTTGGRG